MFHLEHGKFERNLRYRGSHKQLEKSVSQRRGLNWTYIFGSRQYLDGAF